MVGDGLSIDGYGVLSATAADLPMASETTLGGVRIYPDGAGGILIDSTPGAGHVFLAPATDASIGGVVVGAGLTVDEYGVLSADAGGYTLPEADTTTLGGVKVGTGLSVTAGVLSVPAPARTATAYTTGTLAQYGVADFTMPLGEVCSLLALQASEPSWVRIYRSSTQRGSDTRSAPGGLLQTMIDLGDARPYSENVTQSSGETITQNPPALLMGDASGLVYVRLIKQSGGSAAVTLTATTLLQES
jgi:hypothetical protein